MQKKGRGGVLTIVLRTLFQLRVRCHAAQFGMNVTPKMPPSQRSAIFTYSKGHGQLGYPTLCREKVKVEVDLFPAFYRPFLDHFLDFFQISRSRSPISAPSLVPLIATLFTVASTIIRNVPKNAEKRNHPASSAVCVKITVLPIILTRVRKK